MPPPSIPTGQAQTPIPTTSSPFTQLFKLLLLVVVVATCIRSTLIYFTWRKSRIAVTAPSREEKRPEKCILLPEKGPAMSQPAPNELMLSHGICGEQAFQTSHSTEQAPPTFRPIYPWTGPPQTLPGPYDPRLFPLPTVRRHSSVDAVNQSGNADAGNTISYTRRVSTNSIPARHSTLHGSITRSSRGWRRNQWVVSGE